MRLYDLRAVYVGGNANNGSNAGFGYSNTNNAASNANANIGARLSLIYYINRKPCLMAKKQFNGAGIGSIVEDSHLK